MKNYIFPNNIVKILKIFTSGSPIPQIRKLPSLKTFLARNDLGADLKLCLIRFSSATEGSDCQPADKKPNSK